MSQILRFVALAATGLFLTSTPASAADQWSAPSTAIPAGPAAANPRLSTSPAVAADASGALTVVWFGDQTGAAGIYAATRSAGSATWSSPVRIATGNTFSSLTLAVNASGQALVGWLDALSQTSSTLRTASRGATGVWSAPETVQAPPPSGFAGLTLGFGLALSPSGEGESVWSRDFSGVGDVPTESKIALGGFGTSWTSADAPGIGASELRFALDAAGNATLVYLAADSHLYATTRAPGGAWAAAQQLDTWKPADGASSVPTSPQLSVSGTGDAVASWQQQRAGTDDAPITDLLSSTRHAGTWSAVSAVATNAGASTFVDPQLGIDDLGRATAVWTNLTSTVDVTVTPPVVSATTQVQARTATAGGNWGPVASVSPPLTSDVADPKAAIFLSPTLAVAPSGGVAVEWRKGSAAGSELYGAVHRADADWQPAARIDAYADGNSSDDHPLGLVADAQGQVTALWGDGRTLKTSSIALTDPPPTPTPTPTPAPPTPTPAPEQVPTGGTAPAPATPAPAPPVVTKPLVTPAVVAKRLVLAVALVPSKKGKCPATGVATYAGGKTTIKLKKTKLSNKKIVCKVASTITLKAAPTTPTVKVTITAKGVKTKALNVKPTA